MGMPKALRQFLDGLQPVSVTASTVTVYPQTHGNRLVTLNRAAGIAVTLPAAVGSGARYEFVVVATVTSNSTTIKVANATDVMTGLAVAAQDAADTVLGWETAATSDTITFNGTTTGGIKGDHVVLTDAASGLWLVQIIASATSTEATPFSATVS